MQEGHRHLRPRPGAVCAQVLNWELAWLLWGPGQSPPPAAPLGSGFLPDLSPALRPPTPPQPHTQYADSLGKKHPEVPLPLGQSPENLTDTSAALEASRTCCRRIPVPLAPPQCPTPGPRPQCAQGSEHLVRVGMAGGQTVKGMESGARQQDDCSLDPGVPGPAPGIRAGAPPEGPLPGPVKVPISSHIH